MFLAKRFPKHTVPEPNIEPERFKIGLLVDGKAASRTKDDASGIIDAGQRPRQGAWRVIPGGIRCERCLWAGKIVISSS